MIPQSFDEWYYCITQKCRIALNKEFANERLKILTNESHPETVRIAQLYGKVHLENLISWFKKI